MFKDLYPINASVIYNGKFATVTGYDEGEEKIIIEFCDWRDGKLLVVNPFDLTIDEGDMCLTEATRDVDFN
jgi:hypothetical protein